MIENHDSINSFMGGAGVALAFQRFLNRPQFVFPMWQGNVDRPFGVARVLLSGMEVGGGICDVISMNSLGSFFATIVEADSFGFSIFFQASASSDAQLSSGLSFLAIFGVEFLQVFRRQRKPLRLPGGWGTLRGGALRGFGGGGLRSRFAAL